jgi:adenosylhomocysteine nucleosidase
MTASCRSGSERIGIVTGLAAEARIARRLGWPVAVGGGTAQGARAAARGLADQGATALVSFGLAGGLDPALDAGALLVPEAILTQDGVVSADLPLLTWLGGPTVRCLLGAEAVAARASDKHRLWTRTGCAALDLESGPVAQTAAALGLRVAALRVVCDTAGVDLPPAALEALSVRGRIGVARVAASLAHAPRQIPALLQLARSATQARRALSDRVDAIRPACRA